MSLKKWFHHLLNPHCTECAAEKEMAHTCNTCEVLRQQLEVANLEKMKLLDSIIRKDEPSLTIEAPEVVRPRYTPWRVQRQQLEQAERTRAEQLRRKVEEEIKPPENKGEARVVTEINDTSLEELERELGVGDAS